MLEYLEKADEMFLQHSRDMMQQMKENAVVYAGLMARMVAVMESHPRK